MKKIFTTSPTGFFIFDHESKDIEDAYSNHVDSFSSIKEALKEIREFPEEYDWGYSPYKIFKIKKITTTFEYEFVYEYKGKKEK